MSLLNRLFSRFSYSTSFQSEDPLATLVRDPRAGKSGLDANPHITPWSAERLNDIFQAYQANPNYGSLAEARLARQCLSRFWLAAPLDLLEMLYQSEVGVSHRLLMAGPLTGEALLREERTWRDALSQRLIGSFDQPETTNLLLAAMPYFSPGEMRVADPLRQLPKWLQEDYARLFDPDLFQSIWQPAGLLSPAGKRYGKAPDLGLDSKRELWGSPFTPRLAKEDRQVQRNQQFELPRLSRIKGPEALVMVQGEDYLNRMNGLINLHVIDPDDAEVCAQLGDLRRVLGQIWLDAQPAQLEELYAKSRFGRLYRDLLASGFPKMQLSQQDRLLRNQLARLVSDMSQTGSINALMAALPFYAPGKIAFGGGEQYMPSWLVGEIDSIYGKPTQSLPQ